MFKKLIYLVCFVFVVGVALTSQVDAALPGLVGWWKFDDGSGTTAKDSSRNGHDGTLNGDPQWVAGQLGGALDFDGAGDFVEVPHNPSLSITNEITIAAWTNMRGNASGEMAIVSKGGWSANDLPYELTETPGSIIYWQFYDDGGRDNCAPPSPPVDEWHHIAATYDGTIFKCYIDGQLAQEWGYVGKMPENTASVTIGRRSRGGTSFNGMIDEVAIFNRALGAEEIPNLMIGMGDFGLASEPNPADGMTDVPRDVVLSWTPGEFADKHDVYLGTVFYDVNDASRTNPLSMLTSQNQDPNIYAPPERLAFGETYYWRIDEVNAPPDYTVYEGEVWSFTTELFAYPIENITATASSQAANRGPENTVNGSGLDESGLLHGKEGDDNMWVSDITGPQP
ncbi:MAG: LamG domain-containing protein, partial [Planctomycetota bacterium]